MSPEVGLKLVAEGNFAFHVELSAAYPIIERTFPDKFICELEDVQMLPTQHVFTVYQKQSPFHDLINCW